MGLPKTLGEFKVRIRFLRTAAKEKRFKWLVPLRERYPATLPFAQPMEPNKPLKTVARNYFSEKAAGNGNTVKDRIYSAK